MRPQPIQGTVAGGFEALREQFRRCFDELSETGAGYVAIVGGRVVADLWASVTPSSRAPSTSTVS